MPAVLKCPYCGASVGEQETFCTNCFWDLRKQGDVNPPKTMVTESQAIASEPPAPTEPSPERVPPKPAAAVPPPRAAAPPKPSPPPVKSPPKPEPPKQARAPVASAPPAHELVASTDASDAPTSDSSDVALSYRPRLRPPMATLRIMDDDGQDAESFRIRTAEIVIGRTEGQVQIPHEKLMSSKHAKIVRRFVDGAHRWFLVDLDSTNGTFVRISSCRLQHGAQLMIGSFRYQFDSAPQGGGSGDSDAESPPPNVPERTMGWARVTQEDLLQAVPKLLRISPGGDVTEFKIIGTDLRLGASAAEVEIAMDDDPLLSSVHVRIYQDQHRRWHIEDLGSKNGLWIAIREQELDKRAMIQLGEQRFHFRYLK